MLLGGPNWPNYLIFYLLTRNDWHLWYHFCSLYILSWISLPKGDPVLSCLLGKKEKKVAASVPIWDAIAVIPHWRITRSALCKSTVSIGKSKVFGIRTVVVYFVSSFFFIPMLTIFFTRVSPFFGHCLLSTTDKTKVFLWIPSLATIFSTLFRDFFFAEK